MNVRPPVSATRGGLAGRAGSSGRARRLQLEPLEHQLVDVVRVVEHGPVAALDDLNNAVDPMTSL
jgi:hypothetical protein